MQPKVSVIVPVYNAGVHFQKCLDSLVKQTLKELEIILVLDCPTDGSDKLAEIYAARYHNIILLRNQKNMHIGFSRNRGLEIAQGEYIGFCDHDDYVELNMFEDMYHTSKNNNLDALLIDVKRIKYSEIPKQNMVSSQSASLIKSPALLQDIFFQLLSNQVFGPCFYLYSHLFRKNFLKSHHIIFQDTRKMGAEDLLFNLTVYSNLLKEEGTIAYLPITYYYHIAHQTNTAGTIEFREVKKIIPYLENVYSILPEIENIPPDKIKDAYFEKVIRALYSSWFYELKARGLKSFKNLSIIRNSTIIKENLHHHHMIYDRRFSLTKNIFIYILKLWNI